jgi:hypothetical protein
MAEPTTQYSVTSNIPEWAKEYATKLLGRAEALTEPIYDPATGLYKPQYTPYGGQLVAGFNPLQEQAMRNVARMDVAPEMGQATGFTGLAALQAQNLGRFRPLQQQQYYQSPFEQQQPQARPQLETGGGYMRGPETTYGQTISPVGAEIAEETPRDFGATQYGQTISPMSQAGGYQNPLAQYMSPYMQGVVEQQKKQAVQDYSRQLPGMAAAAARAGAKGGTREALVRAEGQRGLYDQLANIQATGLQNAFQQAQAQAAQDAQLRAQYGLAGSQLGEQSRQFGANLGMQGLQQQLAAARQLADIGGATQMQRQNILQAQMGAGQQAQDLEQRRLSSLYQQFIDEQQAPYKQLGFMSDILRGTPASATTTSIYQQPPNFLASTLGGAGGLATLFGGLGK